ncbi:response regulator transcription factor [Dactylosporangium sp. NBC_01737]|uniref:response regulator transcription factor n=1 Tax=Dactylosporangium sp. NBC_01737 TaxID=2975959 RepID=UPI002E104D52|nr:response regulator transcription factor [Dactylosporangium sp. NBC_01737]
MSDSAGPLRVLVADDHPVFRAGMRQLLDTEPTLTCVAEADGGAEAIRLATALLPDVAVLDLHMPGVNGVDAARAITRETSAVGVLILTMLDDDESVFAAMRAGARGYLLKGAGPAEVVHAIHAVGSGAAVFGQNIAQRVLDHFARPKPADAFADLTNREREILGMLADGHPNARIAEQLHLSPKTVRNHVSSIFAKLHVADRAEAMLQARRAGLGQP